VIPAAKLRGVAQVERTIAPSSCCPDLEIVSLKFLRDGRIRLLANLGWEIRCHHRHDTIGQSLQPQTITPSPITPEESNPKKNKPSYKYDLQFFHRNPK